jgi:hypothetical protein
MSRGYAAVFAQLVTLTEVIGPNYGSEGIAPFLYSTIRLQRSRHVVELGMGLGVSTLWMALALAQNGAGHLWTVEDSCQLDLQTRSGDGTALERAAALVAELGFNMSGVTSAEEYIAALASHLQVENRLSFIGRTIDLERFKHFDDYAFSAQQIDLLFSDFLHGPEDIMRLLWHFLPRMSAASSIFIDSASSYWPSYLLLEQVVGQLNAGKIPQMLAGWGAQLEEFVRTRRITLVHLTDPQRESQNATAWLKIEPVDVVPHPLTMMNV